MVTDGSTQTDLDASTEELAARLIASIEGGDQDGVRSCFAPDAGIWHNIDNAEQGIDEVLKALSWMARHVEGLRYAEIRRRQTGDGYVQQHVIRGTMGDGATVELPSVLVVTVTDGAITHLDEYFDRASLGPLAPADTLRNQP